LTRYPENWDGLLREWTTDNRRDKDDDGLSDKSQ
jgi:hypothetical protein